MLIALLLWNSRLNTYKSNMTEKVIAEITICKLMKIEI